MALNTTVNATTPRDLFDVYGLLVQHCDAPPDGALKDAYGGLSPLLFVALLIPVALAFGENIAMFAASLKAGIDGTVDEMKRCVFCSMLKMTTLWPAG